MENVKHFEWRYADAETIAHGRVAVRVDDQVIQFVRLSGPLPLAIMPEWEAAFEEAFPGLFLQALEDARDIVQFPWRVERRYGMSGSVTFKLRELVSRELLDQPVRAAMHVTMAGKLEEFTMRLGHFYLLLGDMLAEQGDSYDTSFRVHVVEPRELVEEDWNLPLDEQREKISSLLAQIEESE